MVDFLSPEQSGENRAVRRLAASDDFRAAFLLAEHNGLQLVRHTETHYQLMPPGKAWLLNIFPGNCRLHHDRNRPKKPPFLRGFEGRKWTLLEVVEEIIVLQTREASES